MKITKKLLSIALSACMVLTLLPATALAYTSGPLENSDTFSLRTEDLTGNIGVADYTVGSTSLLWDTYSPGSVKFNAWYPVNSANSNTTIQPFDVAGAANPDLMMAAPVTASRGDTVTLQFKHVMHRLVVNLTKDDDVSGNLADAEIRLYNTAEEVNVAYVIGKAEGSSSGSSSYPVKGAGDVIIVAPQTLIAGVPWIEITMGNYKQTLSVPDNLIALDSGKQTILNLELQSGGIVFTSKTVGPWDANGDGNEDVSNVTLDIESVPALPATVDSVTVSPDTATVQKGATRQFTATVTGTNSPSQEVTWTVDGGNSSGTSITASGLLTVGADETEPTLTVWATSTADQTKSGIAEVTVIPPAAPANPVWDDATSPHIAKWDAVADAAVYRVVFYNGNKQIGDVIETGTDTKYDFTNAITAAGYGSFTFEVQVKVNTGAYSKWSDRSAVLPLFSPVTSVTVSPDTAIVQKGAIRQFTATVNATDGTEQTVTWELVGNTSASTVVSADGLLTVGADETGTILNVTATSTVDISKTSTAAVVVPSIETLVNTLTGIGLTADVSGNTVTVTGTKVATDTLALIIPTGVKVLWNASLTGAADAPLILLGGDGTFELAGGEIKNTGTGIAVACSSGNIVISGGTASSASKIATVMTYHMGENPPTLTMTGGNVISTSDDLSSCAISAGGQTVITGGTVTAGSGYQVVLSNAVVVYQRGLLSKISSGSLSASVAVSPSKTYATPTETDGLTATGYSVLADHVTAQWNYSNSGWTGVQVDYSGSASGSWKVSYPAVQVVSGKHLLTYNSNGGEGATPFSTVYKGQSYTVSTNIFTRTNYTFTGWNTEANGTGTPYAEGATLTGGPGSDDIVLYAQWSPAVNGNTNDSGGGSTTTTTPTTTVSGTNATTTVTPKVTNGAATGSVTADQMSDALKKAQAAAGTNGTPNVTIQISGASGASSVGTTIPRASMQSLVSGDVGALTVSGPTGSVSFDAEALQTISGASGDVTVAVAKTDSSTLSTAAQTLVGSHPVFTFSVTSGGNAISQFGGDVTVSVPYTPASGEDTNAIVIYYIAEGGTPTLVPDARYDAATGTVIFTTTHFSTYAVGYNKVSFTDVNATAWYADAVTFLSARGVTSGTTATTFSPDATLTRGQFVTMLLRAYGVAAITNPTDNFTDAGSTYYTGYLAAAKKLGITSGVGENKFAPESAITRQEMFTLLYNALKVLDQLPSGASGKTLASFTDSGSIASWATDAMTVLVKAGTVTGSNGTLNPTGTTTRSEMAQVLYNLLGK